MYGAGGQSLHPQPAGERRSPGSSPLPAGRCLCASRQGPGGERRPSVLQGSLAIEIYIVLIETMSGLPVP